MNCDFSKTIPYRKSPLPGLPPLKFDLPYHRGQKRKNYVDV